MSIETRKTAGIKNPSLFSVFAKLVPSEIRTPLSVLSGWGILTRKHVGIIFVTSTLTVILEATGAAMVYPVLTYVEKGKDMAVLTADSQLWQLIASLHATLGIPVSLLTLSLVVVLLVTLRQVANFYQALVVETTRLHTGKELARRCFTGTLNSRAQNIEKQSVGGFVNLIDYQCHGAASLIVSCTTLWRLTLTFLSYGVVMVLAAPLASMMAGVLVAVIIVSLSRYVRKARELSDIMVRARKEISRFGSERRRAWKVLKLNNMVETETDKFVDEFNLLIRAAVTFTRVANKAQLIVAPVMTIFALVILYISVEYLTITLSIILLFVAITLRLVPVAQSLARFRQTLTNHTACLNEIERVMAAADTLYERNDGVVPFTGIKNAIRFEHVSFAYDEGEHKALNDISTSIPVGRLTAITGPSGAGKSTFLDLLPRVVPVGSGALSFDDTRIEQFDLRSLRDGIAYAPQQPFIFNATIMENVRYARPNATDDEVVAACIKAHADDFIETLPDGHQAVLQEEGVGLSGGQRQRLVLARIFLKKPHVLLLDEPTSALDHESEQHIHTAMRSLVDDLGMTVIVVAHHLTTLKIADKLIVIRNGQLVAEGAPEDLIQQQGWIASMLKEETPSPDAAA
jgi:ATP-binding cassette, subfamily B, bacterial MsbA